MQTILTTINKKSISDLLQAAIPSQVFDNTIPKWNENPNYPEAVPQQLL